MAARPLNAAIGDSDGSQPVFDSKKELLDKIRLGEDSFLELKETRFSSARVTKPHRDSLADELATFANSRGGRLRLGGGR